jgi:carboxymethylenebutenolidase
MTPRILIVEDEPSIAELIAINLTHAGYEVETAMQTEVALNLMKDSLPSLLILDWMLPGIAPTRRRVEIPLVAIVRFVDGKVAHEHIYWDQASVLVQIGLLDPVGLPVVGAEGARKVLNPHLPGRTL